MKVTASQRGAFAGEGIAATASVSGGVAPYSVHMSASGSASAEESATLEEAGNVSIGATAAAGKVVFKAVVTDATGATAEASATTLVATQETESRSEWEATMKDVELTGDWREDILAIARTQLGYQESTSNFIVREDGSIQGYTRYGDWYGVPHEEWCAMFVSFCLHYAGISRGDYPWDAGCENFRDNLKYRGGYADAEDYEPQPGDLIFFNWDSEGDADHIGIVESVSGGAVNTIEGNSGRQVRRKSYALSDSQIMGYGNTAKMMELAGVVIGEEEDAEEEEAADANAAVDTEPERSAYSYGDAEVYFSFEVEGAVNYLWQRSVPGADAWEDIPGSNTANLLLSPAFEDVCYAYRCVATTEAGAVITSGEAYMIEPELAEWIVAEGADEAMLLRALGAKSLESMIFEGNALIYVRTGEAVATYNPETTELIDNRFNLTVATVDMENGVIYPIAAEASEAEVSADAA